MALSTKNKKVIRTVIQTAVGIAVALPGLINASGLDQSLPWVAGALAASAVVTRIMAIPAVQKLLGGLSTEEEDKVLQK